MKKIEDIKDFEDIDTYYGISNIVEEIFEDRVEAHKHLVTANKEIKRLNNIINELEKYIDEDDWTSVNGEIAVRLIKLKLQELKELKENK